MAAPGKAKKAQDQLEKDRERGNLELSRKHILNDLETATHPNHKKQLEAALAHLGDEVGIGPAAPHVRAAAVAVIPERLGEHVTPGHRVGG